MDFELWKAELEQKLAAHLFEHPEQPGISYKEQFRLSPKLSQFFLKQGFRPQRVEQAFKDFYEICFEDGDPMELFNLDGEGIDALTSWCELRHPSGLLGLLTPEGWMRAYLGCTKTGLLRKVESV